MDSLLPILIITVLIVLNGFFVAAEFAIISVPRASIERLANQGHRTARIIHDFLRDPYQQDQVIATAQLGITFASLGLGMYGEHVLAEWIAGWLDGFGPARWLAAHTLASILAVTLLTYLHIVIGEMIPKAMALQQPERIALHVTPALLAFKTLLYPLVIGLNRIGNSLLALIGIRRQTAVADHLHTAEELQLIVQESQEGGLIQAASGNVLQELFEFGELTAAEVMVPRVKVVGLPLGLDPAQLAERLRLALHTRYPVYQGDLDHITGMVHIKDLLRLLMEGRPLTAADVRAVPYVPQTANLDTVLAAMRQARTQLVVVMDEHGGTAGVATIEDLFEEVTGHFDEEATAAAAILRMPDGSWQVLGTVRLDELGDELGLVLDHEDVDTVSGLILTLLNRPPAVGDKVRFQQVELTVAAVAGRGVRVAQVRLA